MESTDSTRTTRRKPDRWNSVPVPANVAQRAITNVDKQPDGCWISRYSVGSHGYAQVGWNIPAAERTEGSPKIRMVLAHRAAWVAVNGQVPRGVTLDHLCRVRKCVNPDHLRLLSNEENARRNQGEDFPLGRCQKGHPDTERGPIARRTKSGERRWGLTCRPCIRESQQQWEQRNRSGMKGGA